MLVNGRDKMKYLLATTNKAKIRYYGTKLKEKGIDIVTLNDLNVDVDVDEMAKILLKMLLLKLQFIIA